MRAVRQVEAQRLEVVAEEAPAPGEEELLIRVSGCGICGSDLSSFKMGLFDGVPGHELAGVVEAVGPGAEGWAPGQAVGIDPRLPCGECDECRSGNSHRCVDAMTRRTITPGGFAELVTAPLSVVRRLPQGLEPEVACLAEPLAVALHGIERADLQPGQDAIVVGLGSIGLLCVAALRHLGAGRIHGIDPVAARRRLAVEAGADTVFEDGGGARGSLQGVPVILECSGRPEALPLAIDLAAPGGHVSLLGIALAEVTLVPVMWIIREITVRGCINSSGDDYRHALAMLAADPGIGRIITTRIPLEELPAMFEALLHPSDQGKVVVDPRLRG
ncbi:MAG TPA: alcohol dehydrogenase catalytic domain-containing protein [Candidatus Dormibacteraeota bacterium]|nr:alcohol dehydrogenase catalytic domain-containing protein [Candidatus Dormibacteraeota bacterium]